MLSVYWAPSKRLEKACHKNLGTLPAFCLVKIKSPLFWRVAKLAIHQYVNLSVEFPVFLSLYQSLLVIVSLCQSLPVFASLCQSLPVFVSLCQSLSVFVSLSLLRHIQSLPVFVSLFKSFLHKSLINFISLINFASYSKYAF